MIFYANTTKIKIKIKIINLSLN